MGSVLRSVLKILKAGLLGEHSYSTLCKDYEQGRNDVIKCVKCWFIAHFHVGNLCPISLILLLFQALGSFFFIHESLKNIHQFDFKGESSSSSSPLSRNEILPLRPLIPPLHIPHNHLQAIPTSIKTSQLRLALRIM